MFIETHLKQCKVSDVGSGTGYQMETGVTGEEELSEPGDDNNSTDDNFLERMQADFEEQWEDPVNQVNMSEEHPDSLHGDQGSKSEEEEGEILEGPQSGSEEGEIADDDAEEETVSNLTDDTYASQILWVKVVNYSMNEDQKFNSSTLMYVYVCM